MAEIGEGETKKPTPRRRCVQSKLFFTPPESGGGGVRREVDEENDGDGEGEIEISPSGNGRKQKPKLGAGESLEEAEINGRKGKRRISRATETSPDIIKEAPRSSCRYKKTSSLSESSPKRCEKGKSQDDAADVKICTDEHYDENLSSECGRPTLTKGQNLKLKMRQKNAISDCKRDFDNDSPNLQQCIDLRFEARRAAEENLRLFAWKQTHPFFSFWKTTKKASEMTDIVKWEGKHISEESNFLSVHVFDAEEDDVPLDWRNWLITETPRTNEFAFTNVLPVLEGSLQPLTVDAISCKGDHINDLVDDGTKNPCGSSGFSPRILSNGRMIPDAFSQTEMVQANGSLSSAFKSENVSHSLEGYHEKMTKERLDSYYQRCSSLSPGGLWTHRYRPEIALEICGNREPIMFLSDWLNSWHGCVPKNRSPQCSIPYDVEDLEDSLYIDDVSETEDDADKGRNVLLITGPVGCGKSAAIYACAKEQGFEVIEIGYLNAHVFWTNYMSAPLSEKRCYELLHVNASDLRTGSRVKDKFGEATESHGFGRWSLEEDISFKKNHFPGYTSNQSDVIEVGKLLDESIELAEKITDQDVTHVECDIENFSNSQVATKSLILFEDVDIVFDEDRGFISAILQLAESSKRPIILTSNNEEPMLPHPLNRLVLNFKLPSSSELFYHVWKICDGENADISPSILDHLINFCQRDIRRTVTFLQFWCQGKGSSTERNVHCTYSPLLLDINAAHKVIPRIIPWEFRCELAEKVEEELSKAISQIGEEIILADLPKDQYITPTKMQDSSFCLANNLSSTIKSLRKGRLKKKPFSPGECLSNDLDDYSDALDSPVRVDRHTRRAIFPSQSDDELRNGSPQVQRTDPLHPTDALLPYCFSPHLMQSSANGINIAKPIPFALQFGKEDTIANESSEAASISHVCDTFKLQDVSCESESPLCAGVNEKDITLPLEVSHDLLSVSLFNFTPSSSAVPGAIQNEFGGGVFRINGYLEENVGNACDVEVESVHGTDETKEFQDDGVKHASIGYQMLDECSHTDCSRCMDSKDNAECLNVGLLRETWKTLRDKRNVLKACLATDWKEACLVVNVTSKLTHIISEADVLFSSCSHCFSDVLEPSSTALVELDDFCWYDRQCQIGSTYAEHGLCMYTGKCAAMGSTLGLQDPVDLTWELLASSTNTLALGKLLTSQASYAGGNLTQSRHCISAKRKGETEVYRAIASSFPTRLTMAFEGSAYHEYLSFMSQISKIESDRLSKTLISNHRRRSRASRRYLSLALPEHAELLAQSFCFGDSVEGS